MDAFQHIQHTTTEMCENSDDWLTAFFNPHEKDPIPTSPVSNTVQGVTVIINYGERIVEHSTGICVDLFRTEGVLRLKQYPEFGSTGTHVSFDINFNKSTISTIRQDGEDVRPEVCLTLQEDIQPSIREDDQDGIVSSADRVLNVRVWCTIPFAPLSSNTKIIILLPIRIDARIAKSVLETIEEHCQDQNKPCKEPNDRQTITMTKFLGHHQDNAVNINNDDCEHDKNSSGYDHQTCRLPSARPDSKVSIASNTRVSNESGANINYLIKVDSTKLNSLPSVASATGLKMTSTDPTLLADCNLSTITAVSSAADPKREHRLIHNFKKGMTLSKPPVTIPPKQSLHNSNFNQRQRGNGTCSPSYSPDLTTMKHDTRNSPQTFNPNHSGKYKDRLPQDCLPRSERVFHQPSKHRGKHRLSRGRGNIRRPALNRSANNYSVEHQMSRVSTDEFWKAKAESTRWRVSSADDSTDLMSRSGDQKLPRSRSTAPKTQCISPTAKRPDTKPSKMEPVPSNSQYQPLYAGMYGPGRFPKNKLLRGGALFDAI